MTMQRIGKLAGEIVARIEAEKEKAGAYAGGSAIAPAVKGEAGEDRGPQRPFPTLMQDAGNVIPMPVGKRRTLPHAGRPACVLRFPIGIERVKRHAAALTSRRSPH